MKKNRKRLPEIILLMPTLISAGIIYAATVSASECKTIAEYCQQINQSLQDCFDHIKIPEGGEALSIGAQIQINCTTSIIACNAKISGGDKLSCFSSAPPAIIPSSKFQLVNTTPNDVCRAFNIGSAQKMGVYYLWCPKT